MAEEAAEKGDNPQQKSAQLLAAEEVRKLLIAERRKKIVQRRALRIVLQLARRRVTANFLCNALSFIEPQDWDDAVDERNAEGLCGYVFCTKKPLLSQGKKQRYRICSKTNRVYDMENYNPFCSVWCSKASRHIRRQIEEKPIVEREGARRLTLTFLDEDSDAAETAESAGRGQEEEEVVVEEEEEEKEEKRENEEEKREVKEKENLGVVAEDAKKAKRSTAMSRRTPRELEAPTPRVPPLDGAKTALRSWLTSASLAWLEGRPVSDAADAEAEVHRGKVRRFLARRRKEVDVEAQEDAKEEVEVTLPLVDSISQDAIRRRIVGAKLDTYLRDLAPALQLEVAVVSAPLRQLLRSFDFTATNIVLRPREWRAAAVLLLELVARREPAVRGALDRDEAAAVLLAFAEDTELGLQEIVDECAMLTVD